MVLRAPLLCISCLCRHLKNLPPQSGIRLMTAIPDEQETFLESPSSLSLGLLDRIGSHARTRSPHLPEAWHWYEQCRLIMILHPIRNKDGAYFEYTQKFMGWGARGGNGCGVSSQLGWPYQGEPLCHHIISLAPPHVINTLVSTFTINSLPDYSMLSLCYLFLIFYLLMRIMNF